MVIILTRECFYSYYFAISATQSETPSMVQQLACLLDEEASNTIARKTVIMWTLYCNYLHNYPAFEPFMSYICSKPLKIQYVKLVAVSSLSIW